MCGLKKSTKMAKLKVLCWFNTREGSAYALDPRQQIYMVVQNKAMAKLTGELTKGKSNQKMNGYSCKEYTVVNKDLDRQCRFLVAHDEFDFFIPLLNTLKRKENLVLFYMSLPDSKGGFPMLGEEKDLAGNLIMRLEVTQVTKANVGDDLFFLPSTYSEFKK